MSTDNPNMNNQPHQMHMSTVLNSNVSYKEDQPIEYEYPSEKVGNKFNVSVASLGDIYKFGKEDDEQYDLLFESNINASKELKRNQRDPNTGRPSSSTIMKQKGKVNNVFLNPYSIQTKPNPNAIKKSRVVELNYLHMTEVPDSKKYSHVPNGIINPPKSSFSVKNIVETNLKKHEEEIKPTVVYPNRVRIHIVAPENKTFKQSRTLTEGNKNKDSFILIGKKVNVNKDLHTDDHVQMKQSREVVYKQRALSSNKARKTLLVSEKFVGAVHDYFRSSEMKIPAKNSIDQIATYAKNVEKSLNKFTVDIENRENNKAKTAVGKYMDPYSKRKKKKNLIKPHPPKIYPIIDNDYQKNVEEKLAKLQIELRQIFDALSQQGTVEHGDDEKVKSMICKARELTTLMTHLADDVKKSKEFLIKQKKDKEIKEKEKANQTNETINQRTQLSSSTDKKNIVEISTSKINQSIQLNNLNITTMPNTQPQVTDSQILQPPQQPQPQLQLQPLNQTYHNQFNQKQKKPISNIIMSAINPVQESMINTSRYNYKDSLIQTIQSIDKTKPNHVSFNTTIQEQPSKYQQQDPNQSTDKSMTLPNYNVTMPQFTENQKIMGNKSQREFNPLFSSSKTQTNNQNPLYTSTASNDPNITLNNYKVEANKIKIDNKNPILDERFTAFNIELPVQYYFEVSKDREPNQEKEWYIRPHHTETFTPNEHAIPDDVLNTKYISYYGSIPKKETKTRQDLLEEMIVETRGNIDHLQYEMFTKIQFDKEKEELYARLEKLKEEAKKEYVPGQFLDKDKDKKAEKISDLLETGETKIFSEMFDGNEEIHQTNFVLDTYNKLRSEVMNKEQQILIKKRKEEYDRIRPPKKNWYELRGADFQEEMQRNKMVINAGPEYFEKIKELRNNELY